MPGGGSKALADGRRRFVYKSFSEQLDAIHVDVHHDKYRALQFTQAHTDQGVSSAVVTGSGAEDGTHLGGELARWRELTCSREYVRFMASVFHDVGSLPLLILNSEKVFESLMQGLESTDVHSYKALLSCLVGMARDLRQQFLPFFSQFMKHAVVLLGKWPEDQLEDLFMCLAFLMKLLVKDVATNFEQFLSTLLPLLSHKRHFLRRFSSEACAHVIRKCPRQMVSGMIKACFKQGTEAACAASSIYDRVALEDGVARLMFESAKGPKQSLHSRALPLLKQIVYHSQEAAEANDSAGCRIGKSAILYCMDHVRSQTSGEIWEAVLDGLSQSSDSWHQNGQRNSDCKSLQVSMSLVAACVVQRTGTRLLDDSGKPSENILSRIRDILSQLKVQLEQMPPNSLALEWFVLAGAVARSINARHTDSVEPFLQHLFGPATERWLIKTASMKFIPQSSFGDKTSESTTLISSVLHLVHLFTGMECWPVVAGSSIVLMGNILHSYQPQQKQPIESSVSKRNSIASNVIPVEIISGIIHSMLNAPVVNTLPTKVVAFARELVQISLSWSLAKPMDVSSQWAVAEVLRRWLPPVSELMTRDDLNSLSSIVLSSNLDRQVIDSFCGALSSVAHLMSTEVNEIKQTVISRLLGVANQRELTSQSNCESVMTYMSGHCQLLRSLLVHHTIEVIADERTATRLILQLRSGNQADRVASLQLLQELCRKMPSWAKLGQESVHDINPRRSKKQRQGDQSESSAKDSIADSTPDLDLQTLLLAVEQLEACPLSATDGHARSLCVQKITSLVDNMKTSRICRKVVSSVVVAAFRTPFATTWPAVRALAASLARVDGDSFWNALWDETTKEMRLVMNVRGSLLDLDDIDSNSVAQPEAEEKFKMSRRGDEGRVVSFDTVEEAVRGATRVDSIAVLSALMADAKLLVSKTNMPTSVGLAGPSLKQTSGTALIVELLKCIENSAFVAERNCSDVVSMLFWLLDRTLEFPGCKSEKYEEIMSCLGGIGRKQWAAVCSELLKVMAKFRKSKSLSITTECAAVASRWGCTQTVYEIMLKLLTRNQTAVQRSALDVIKVFGIEGVNLYFDNLARVIDPVSFRDELSCFVVNSSKGVVASEHRSTMLPVLIHILFSRLSDRRAGGGASLHSKRSAVLTFLGGLSSDELEPLVELMLEPFAHCLKNRLDVSIQTFAHPSFALEEMKTVPGGRKMGYLNCLASVWKQLGASVAPWNVQLVKPLLCLLVEVSQQAEVFEDHQVDNDEDVSDDDEEQPQQLESNEYQTPSQTAREPRELGSVKDIRAARKVCLELCTILVQRFGSSMLDSVQLSKLLKVKPKAASTMMHEVQQEQTAYLRLESQQSSIDFLDSAIQVLDSKFIQAHSENTQAKSALLKFVLSLSQSPFCSYALFKHMSDGLPLISHVVHVLSSPKVSLAASQLVLDSLLAVIDSPLCKALAPHVPGMLRILEKRFANNLQANPAEALDLKEKKRAESVQKLELEAISSLSEFECDALTADSLCRLLTPYLHRRKGVRRMPLRDDARRNLLKSLLRLFSKANNPCQYLSTVCSQLLAPGPADIRQIAASLLRKLSPTFERIGDFLEGLNTMKKGRVEEPDWDTRAEIYGKIAGGGGVDSLVQTMQWTEVYVLLCQCFHDIKIEDLAIRSASAAVIRVAISKIQRQISSEDNGMESDVDEDEGADENEHSDLTEHSGAAGQSMFDSAASVLQWMIIPNIKRLLASTDAVCRHEAVSLFAFMCKTIPSSLDPGLVSLASEDPDACFYTNVTHIQAHRRARALAKLSRSISDGKVGISNKAAAHYLQPLLWNIAISPADYGQSGRASAAVSVPDEAVAALSSLSSVLQWRNYSGLLSNAMRALDNKVTKEKLLVRLIVSILEKFHFPVIAPSEPSDLQGDLAGQNKTERNDEHDQTAEVEFSQVASAKLTTGLELDFVPEETNAEEVEHPPTEFEMRAPTRMKTKERLIKIVEDAGNCNVQHMEDISETHTRLGNLVYQSLNKKLLGGLYRHLNKSSGGWKKASKSMRDAMKLMDERRELEEQPEGGVRQSLAVAIVQVLMKMPKQSLAMHLPRVVRVVCQACADKDEAIRLHARKTISRCACLLGPAFLPYLVDEMRSTMNKGYQTHVLGHCMYDTVAALHSEGRLLEGGLHPCLECLMDVYIEEMCGDVGKQKEVTAIVSKTKEAKSSRAGDIMHIIGEACHVSRIKHDVLQALCIAVRRSTAARFRLKVEELLRRLRHGLAKSSISKAEELFTLCFNVLDEYGAVLSARSAAKKGIPQRSYEDSSTAKSEAMQLKHDSEKSSLRIPTSWVHTGTAQGGNGLNAGRHAEFQGGPGAHPSDFTIAAFAIDLLLSAVKKGKLDPSLGSSAPMIGPFVVTLSKTTRCKHDCIVSGAFKALVVFAPCPCKQWEDVLRPLVDDIFSHLKKSGANGEIAQSCFKMLSVIMRQPKFRHLGQKWESEARVLAEAKKQQDKAKGKSGKGAMESKLERVGILRAGQLRVLLSFIEHDIEEPEKQGAAFSLLRAILSCKLMTPELYDLMTTVLKLLVKCPIDSVRAQARASTVQFLLEYPLGPQRIKESLSKLLTNLDFAYEQGRKSVLETLHTVASKFPEDVLSKYFDLLLLPLVLRLVVEPSSKIKAMVSAVAGILISRCGGDALDKTVQMIELWSTAGQTSRQLAAVALGVCVVQETKPTNPATCIRLVQVAESMLQMYLKDAKGQNTIENVSDAEENAESDIGWTKMEIANEDDSDSETEESENSWQICHLSCKIVHLCIQLHGSALVTYGVGSSKSGSKSKKSDMNMASPKLIFRAASPAAILARHPWVRKAAADTLSQLIVISTAADTSTPSISSLSKFSINVIESIASIVHALGAPGLEEPLAIQLLRCVVPLMLLLHSTNKDKMLQFANRCGRFSRIYKGIRRKTYLQLFAALALKGPDGVAADVLESAVQASFKASQSEEDTEDSCKAIAQEVLELFQNKVGVAPVLEAIKEQRGLVQTRKDERRRKAKIRRMVDVAGAAESRMRKNVKKRKAEREKRVGSGKMSVTRAKTHSEAMFDD